MVMMIKGCFAVLSLLLASQCLLQASSQANSCSYDKDKVTATIFSSASVRRRVDQERGVNTIDCLSGNSSSPPCQSLHFALHGVEEVEGRSNLRGVVVELSPGTYNLSGGLGIVNSVDVAILGAGPEKSIFTCGEFGDNDRVCDYMNFQIRNSSSVYINGVTFTRCGPITSAVYVAFSDNIYFENCVFRDTLSPSLLVHNTQRIVLESCSFSNNHPAALPPQVTSNICYFSAGQDIFFVDNRTTSGGISFYIRDLPTNFFIINCTFLNNSARPDNDVSLVRRSETYGHGGALNVRLLHSSNSFICIGRSTFIGNSAQAHGGGVVLSLAGNASHNHFLVSESLFELNYCTAAKCTGGGIGLDLLSGSQRNKLEITKSNFTGNSANASGAIALSTSVSAEVGEDEASDVLILWKCFFTNNKAFFEGTALGAYSLTHTDQIGMPLEIRDCYFRENVGIRGSADTTAITAYRVLITFYGNTSFHSNQGGGVSLLSSRMDVKGTVIFDNNTAVFGAGVAMSGRSLILLYNGSYVDFSNNFVSQFGAGIYVEYASSDFLLSVLNTGCFIRYYTLAVDIPPEEWKTSMVFTKNTAMLAGAGIYANDMTRCKWLGNISDNYTIFEIPSSRGPFLFTDNKVLGGLGNAVVNHNLATDSSRFVAKANFNTSASSVAFGERVSFQLSSTDELGNFRETVWSVSAPLEDQPLGSISSNNSRYVYNIPDRGSLTSMAGFQFANTSEELVAEFSLLQSLSVSVEVNLNVSTTCHPGYGFDSNSQECVCLDQRREVVRCDSLNRYFYTQDGFWIGVRENGSIFSANTIPGFLTCSRLGTLPGCLFKFDASDEQCAAGRTGTLCGDCKEEYGVTFDLRRCSNKDCSYGPALFVAICVITLVVSLAVLYFDFPLPNELKGVIFFAQVIGVIYRNTPSIIQDEHRGNGFAFLDFVINMLGFAMPFPVCFHKHATAFQAAFLGFFPPIIATLTAVLYSCCANRSRKLSHRDKYGFHGFYFLFLFVYKYFVDTSFTFISCTNVNGEKVFLYQGTMKCYSFPFVIMLVIGSIVIVALVIALPLYALYVIYRPAKMIQFSNALTHGLKEERSYLWYSVWDIWRRVMFVGVNLFISVTTRSVVLFIHCLLILVSLCVLCCVKPYKKYHINVIEMLVLLSLFGATVSVLDENDVYIGPTVSASFIAFPFLYGLGFIVYRATRRVVVACWYFALKKWHIVKLEAALSSFNDKMLAIKRMTIELLEGDGDNTNIKGERERQEDGVEVKGGLGEGDDDDDDALTELREPLLEEL